MAVLCVALAILVAYLLVMRLDAPLGALVSPLRVWAALGIVTTVPYLVLLAIGSVELSGFVVSYVSYDERDLLIVKFGALFVASIFAFVVGYQSKAATVLGQGLSWARLPLPETNLRLLAVVVLGTGAFVWAILIIQLGGAWAILTNLGGRNEMFSGVGYLFQVGSGLMTFGVLLGIFSIGQRDIIGRKEVAVWILLTVFVAVALSISGGRKGTIHLALSALLIWHFCVRPIQRISLGVLVGAFVLFAYFVLMLVVRELGGLDVAIDRPDMLVRTTLEIMGYAVANLSYVDINLFVMHWFDRNVWWYGATFTDLFFSWMPSAVFPDKPPVDDGRYIMSLSEGWRVSPGLANRQLFPSSLPPETFGSGFLNFGALGVVTLHCLLGSIVRSIEVWTHKNKYDFFSMVIFTHALLNLEVSNLRVVQLVTTIALAVVVWLSISLTHRALVGQRF